MARFALRRLLQASVTILGVLTITFFLVRLSGDPTDLLLPVEATAADREGFRAALGLDRSLLVQYWLFLLQAAKGDFGLSLRQQLPALQLVLERLPATAELALTAFGLGIGVALAAGLASRLARRSTLRTVLLWIAFVRQAIPTFFFGLLLILLFSVTLRWLPSVGRGDWHNLILPATTLATYELALYLRLINAAFAEEAAQDYVRTAYAKGHTRRRVILRHILPNALLPLVTVAGINLGVLLGGAVVTETVFGWPGVGRLIIQSVSQRDYPVIVAGVMVISVVFVMLNLLVDFLYAFLDPRIRLA